MLLLAVSAALAISGGYQSQLSERESATWKRVEPSVVFLDRSSSRGAAAALIDTAGWFLANRSSLPATGQFEGHFSDGQVIRLSLVQVDNATQLALLRTSDGVRNKKPVSVFKGSLAGLTSEHPIKLIVALPDGPLRAELVGAGRVGVMDNRSKAAVPMSEIHLELPQKSFGGALAFSLDGELVGALSATLGAANVADAQNFSSTFGGGGAAKAASPIASSPPWASGRQNYGPAGMTVAYSPTPNAIQQVVDGFLSPSHLVVHSYLGVLVRDAEGRGAAVDTVLEHSPAEDAGLKKGDIITEVAGMYVHDKVSFVRTMMRQIVGTEVLVAVLRDGKRKLFRVRVGS